MKNLDENTSLAIIFSNVRRKKRDNDLITIAKSFNYLVNLYGSIKSVSIKIGLSKEMVRQFLSILKLPKEIQELFSKRKLDSVDIAKELLSLKNSRKQIIAAQAILDSSSKDVRDIKRLIKNSNTSVTEAKKTILDLKPKGLHIFMMDFEDDLYKSILNFSKSLRIKPAELVKRIIIDWLKRNS